jgi:hypothetical protein
MGIKLHDINIVGNDDNTFIESNLDDFLNSKYQYEMNTEILKQSILLDIEKWYMKNINLWDWERNNIYRKFISDQIEKIKLQYYTILINQSNLDEDIQRNMILKYKTGRTENEWKNYLNEK